MRNPVWIIPLRQLSDRFIRRETIHNPAYRNTNNPYSWALFKALRINGTILPSILSVVLAVFVESVVVAVLYMQFHVPINLDDRMISMMGSAIAMLLAFRTNRSFERYNQGSQLWTNMSSQIRHSARLIWTTITPLTMKGEMEKAKIMKLLLATAVATKYALQGKDPYKFKDLNQLLPADFISRGSSLNSRLRRHSSADIFSSRSRQSSLIPSLSNTSPQANVDDDALPALPKSTINKHTFPAQFASARSRDDVHAATADGNTLQRRCLGNVINVPLDILHHIANYARVQRKSGALAAEDAAATVSAIASVIDCVTKYEQILYFPVPQSYDIHIKQVLILYFALLPLQLVKPMGWAMVLATFVMSVTFFGIDAIAGEISDPFGNDENDLPLDYFCQKLREDLEYIMDSRFDVSVLSSDEDFKESPGTTTNEEDVGTETKRQLRKRK